MLSVLHELESVCSGIQKDYEVQPIILKSMFIPHLTLG